MTDQIIKNSKQRDKEKNHTARHKMRILEVDLSTTKFSILIVF